MRNCGHQLRDASLNHCAGKAEIDRDPVYLTVAQQTYDLTKQLAADKFAPSPSSTGKDLAFLRVDGVTATRLAHLEKFTGSPTR